jgi:hypothetical protein
MSSEGRVAMRARLLGARMAGASSSASGTDRSEAAVAITAEEIRANRVAGRAISKVGSDEQVEFWTSEDKSETCLYTTWDEYAAYTCKDTAEVQADGISSKTSGPEFEAEVRVPVISKLARSHENTSGIIFSVNHLD